MTHEDAVHVGLRFCEQVGVDASADSLRGVSPEKLLAAQAGMRAGSMPFQPCVDGDLLPEIPLTSVAQGFVDLGNKQVVIGTTANEWDFFSPAPRLTRKPLVKLVRKAAAHLGPARMGSVGEEEDIDVLRGALSGMMKALRSEGGLNCWGAAENRLYTWLIFHAPARLAAEALSRTADKVFVYSFDFDAGRLGAAHATELPLLFGTHRAHWVLKEMSGFNAEPEAADHVSKKLMECFASFARAGSPAPPAEWPQYTSAENPRVFVFDRECKAVQEPDSVAFQQLMGLIARAQRPYGVKSTVKPRARL